MCYGFFLQIDYHVIIVYLFYVIRDFKLVGCYIIVDIFTAIDYRLGQDKSVNLRKAIVLHAYHIDIWIIDVFLEHEFVLGYVPVTDRL